MWKTSRTDRQANRGGDQFGGYLELKWGFFQHLNEPEALKIILQAEHGFKPVSCES